MYVFGIVMSIFGFVVSLLILTGNEPEERMPNHSPRNYGWRERRASYLPPRLYDQRSLTEDESDFLLLFLVCLGSLALILTGRIMLAIFVIKAQKNETRRTIRAIRNVGVTFDMSQFPRSSAINIDDEASNPPTYSDCVKDDGNSLPRYSDLQLNKN